MKLAFTKKASPEPEAKWFVGTRRIGLEKHLLARNPTVRNLRYHRFCNRDTLGEY